MGGEQQQADNTKTNKCKAIITVTGGHVKNKRYYATEDDDLDAPLNAGWKRETTIREYTKSGIRGEVVYVAPCGKRFKQYPDIIRVSGIVLQSILAVMIIHFVLCSIWRKEESPTSREKTSASAQKY